MYDRVLVPFGANSWSSTMGSLQLISQFFRELWKERDLRKFWELRFLVLLSLLLQLILATVVTRRKNKIRRWNPVMIWTAYILTDSITNLVLGMLSNHLANYKERKWKVEPWDQIPALWAPILLLHLGGPDAITAFIQEDNEQWLRQLARLCVQVGLVSYICYMAVSGSRLGVLAAGMILVGFIKNAEKTLCMYLASKSHLRYSMLSPRIMEQKEVEGHQVEIGKGCEAPAPEDFPESSCQTSDQENATSLFKAYDLFDVFKPLFFGLIRNFGVLDDSRLMFMNSDMDSRTAFEIVEIELGFMYDLLYTKALLLNCAWGIIRWVISLSVPCAVLVSFSRICSQYKEEYRKVDITITFLLVSVVILLEIYSLLLAISSDWVSHWRLSRLKGSTASSAMALLQFCPNQRWSNSVAQFSLFRSSTGKMNGNFLKYLGWWLAKLDDKLVMFYIPCVSFKNSTREWIFHHMRDTVKELKDGVASLKLEASQVLKRSNCEDLIWSVQALEFDQTILIWHIATELCYYMDREKMQGKSPEDFTTPRMSKLVSRYMLYLLVCYPSMLPAGIGVLRYKDATSEAQKFCEDKLGEMSKNRGSVSSAVIEWVKKLFKKERHFHTGVKSCKKGHWRRETRDRCELCHLLLQTTTNRREGSACTGERRSVLSDAVRLVSQLNNIASSSDDLGKKWDVIGKVWARMLIYAACQCKGHEHCERLNSGGELLSHVWLLMAHLGVAEAVQTSDTQCAAELNNN